MRLYANDATNADSINILNHDQPTAPLHADYQAFLAAPMASVFDAFANDERFCQLVPNLQQVTVCQSENGLIRQCNFGNDMIVEQRIVLCQPPSVYIYSINTPNPLGVRQHYSIVACQPQENGTHLRWQHYFEHDDLVAMVAMLDAMFEHILAGLCAQFEGQRLS